MNWTPELKAFVAQHLEDNTDRILLSAHRYPTIDVHAAVEQIRARCQIKNKLPEWYALDDLILGGRIPAEQCSSEQTARYKRQLVVGESLCDMTGGMGVDFYYMSKGLKRAVYTERQAHLVAAITHNLNVLYGASDKPDFIVREGDGRELPIPDVDTIYLDPARRATDGSRVYDLAECEPNVVAWQDELKNHCKKLIVKLSPMADISRVLAQLEEVTDVHIVATRNECKEVLVEMNGRQDCDVPSSREGARIHCVDFRSQDVVRYDYYFSQEQMAQVTFVTDRMPKYLYEPDVTLLKAGAFKQVCEDFGVLKLDSNSHFYASEELRETFPGRVFEVDEVLPFSSKQLKKLKAEIPQANITARNFPLTAEQLRSRASIRDGGSVYLIATTIKHLGASLLRCHKAMLVMLLFVLSLCSVNDAFARRRVKKPQQETLESLMLTVTSDQSPFSWHQGKPFVYMNDRVSPQLLPEGPLQENDTIRLKGSIWTFDAIVSEEDWMGQQKMQLRFLSPQQTAFRFNTERVLTQRPDTNYRPPLGCLQPYDVVEKVDALLRARTLYIMINDERIVGGDDLNLEKFVTVQIDSVTVGSELAPLRVWFSQGEKRASFFTSLPGSREKSSSTTIERFLSLDDPYLSHPDISKEVWQLIKRNQLRQGMTTEEVRLSLGRPLRFERLNTKSGAVERWYYANSRVLEFWDNRLSRVGREQ